MNLSLKTKIKNCIESEHMTFATFAKSVLGITYDGLMKKFSGKSNFSLKDIKKIVKFADGYIAYEDFFTMCEDNKYSNNQNSKVKNNKDTVSTACEDNGDIVCNTSA